MNMNNMTGRPSIDRPWMKYYPEVLRNLQIPACTLMEYLKMNCPGENVIAMHKMVNSSRQDYEKVYNERQNIIFKRRAITKLLRNKLKIFSYKIPKKG